MNYFKNLWNVIVCTFWVNVLCLIITVSGLFDAVFYRKSDWGKKVAKTYIALGKRMEEIPMDEEPQADSIPTEE